MTTAPGPTLIYRTIGGMLHMYFFPGPSPSDVIQQYQALIGKPFLPAYWGLGYQFSRYGYKSLDDLQSTISRITTAGIPLDTAVIDIDYMERYKDFTIGQQVGVSREMRDTRHRTGPAYRDTSTRSDPME